MIKEKGFKNCDLFSSDKKQKRGLLTDENELNNVSMVNKGIDHYYSFVYTNQNNVKRKPKK